MPMIQSTPQQQGTISSANESSRLLGQSQGAGPVSPPLATKTGWLTKAALLASFGLLAVASATLYFSQVSSRQQSPPLQVRQELFTDQLLTPDILSEESHHSAKSTGSTTSSGAETSKCISMCLGVYSITCMSVGNKKKEFPGGIFGGIVVASDRVSPPDGLDYYMFSQDDPYLGNAYWEYGRYQVNMNISAPTTAENCQGGLDLVSSNDGTEWSPSMHLDMEWNSVNHDNSFLLGTTNGFT
jgi:hypothetical protein